MQELVVRAALLALLGTPLPLGASVPDTTQVRTAQAADSGALAVGASTGDSFICVVRPSGRTECWGTNGSGQLGLGRVSRRTAAPAGAAILPAGAASRVVSVAVGHDFGCALDARTRIACWGDNSYGQLGDGTTRRRLRPVAVRSTEAFTAVSAGDGFACALNRDGRAFCWGKNDPVSLGTGDTLERHSPTPVQTALRFSRLSVGPVGTSCAIARDSLAYCWGLGIETDTVLERPTLVSSRVKFRDISVGNDFVCGISIVGDLYCWGANAYGQLARPASVSHTLVPTDPIPGGRKFAAVSTAATNVCAIATDNELLCWGNNDFGLVGAGSVGGPAIRVPTPVGSPTRFRAVSVGASAACAISTDDRLYCWGQGARGGSGPVPASFTRSVPERF